MSTPESNWSRKGRVLDEMYAAAYRLGGDLSGEHGIWAKRREDLVKFMGPVQLQVIRAIKRAFDPGFFLDAGEIMQL